MIEALALEAGSVKTLDEFKEWTRNKIRPFFPHERLASCYGRLQSGGVGLDCVVTVDCPISYLEGIRNRAGGIDSPIIRRWLITREPQLFEAEHPWPDVPSGWLECFRKHGMKNIAAHCVYDTERCVATYHCFFRMPGRLGGTHVEALKQLAPIMHEVLCRVIESPDIEDEFEARLAGLSPREKEIARWVGLGKSNGEIADLCGLSENTVKHHVTHIFRKLAVETRPQLVHRLNAHAVNLAPGFAAKIL